MDWDVIVIGGGPAGSTAGALLAAAGRRVLLFEKEQFPRYRVGESLLPYCYPTLERLGVLDRMGGAFSVVKHSVQFVTTEGRCSHPFYFFQHIDHPLARTWQVRRDAFDRMLLDNAREKGAVVREGTPVRTLIEERGAVTGVVAQDAEHRARFVVDASGRDALSAHQRRWRIADPALSRVAIWGYWQDALRDDGLDEGATTVAYLPGKGWFWYIPLPDRMTSVGVVARKEYLHRDGKDSAAILEREAQVNPWIREHLAPGERIGEVRVTGDYSYRARHCAADGLVLVGDAFAFLDPVFSSGVFLALKSGEMAADAIDAALAAGDCSAARFDDYGRELCRAVEAMRRLVYAFYDEEFSFGRMLGQHPELRGDLTDCLIGNLFRDFSALWSGVGSFATLPEPVPHGNPAVD